MLIVKQCVRVVSSSDVNKLRNTRVYPKVSGLAAKNENSKLYSSLPLGAVASLFYESVK